MDSDAGGMLTDYPNRLLKVLGERRYGAQNDIERPVNRRQAFLSGNVLELGIGYWTYNSRTIHMIHKVKKVIV